MKKFGISILLSAVFIGLSLNSCKKDEFSEEDAMNLQAKLTSQKNHEQDSLNLRNQKVSYTVNVVDAATSTLKSGSMVNAVSGAVVKLVQDTLVLTRTVDASGIVTFSNLKPGNANVNITLANYSEVNYTVNFGVSSTTGGPQFSNIIPMIPVAGTSIATISGKVTYESDLTNKTPEAAANVKVLAMIDAESDALAQPGTSSIVKISYGNLALSATTDGNGAYSLTVPATLNGINYQIIVPDFTVDQKLLMPTFQSKDTSGVITVSSSFGESFVNAASDVVVGSPVTVTIDAPTFTSIPASATAVIDNPMGIEYIHNSNVGNFYANGYDFYTTIDNPAVSTGGSKAWVYFTANNGHVDASIDTQGSKFSSNFNGSTITIPYIRVAAKAIVTGVNGSGAITSYQIVKEGEFFSSNNLQFSKLTGAGTGVVTSLPNITGSDYLHFTNLAVKNLATAEGSAFVLNDSIILTVKSDMSDVYSGKIFLTTGSVTAINITNEGSNYLDNQVDVVIESPATGTTATAEANITNGKISYITLNGGGSGYSVAPKVTIINKAQAVQAKYKCTVSDGKVTGFALVNNDIKNQGNGYLTVPKVALTSAIPGAGLDAKAHAIVTGGKVTSVVLENEGSGYRGNTPGAKKQFAGTPSSLEIKGNSATVLNIDLGTGKRSVEN